tara:strand:+ start:5359 stop:6951 length:1593 start_codon:yes stop_codon:yes gene_type:complete
MSGGDEAQLLNETSRIKGKEALYKNIEAADALAGAVKTTLGPKGLDKMLVTENGAVKITNDGASILENAIIEHPIAKMLIQVAITQDNTVYDGTTSTVLISSELLQNAWELYQKGIHPSIISNGYSLAYETSNEFIHSNAIKIKHGDKLENVVKTSLSVKFGSTLRDHLVSLICKTAREIEAKNNLKIIQNKGGSVEDSYLLKGLVLAKQACSPDMKRNFSKGNILILDGGIENKKPTMTTKINITEPTMIAAFREKELALISEQIDDIIKISPDILVCRDGIDDYAIRLLQKNGITAYRRVEKEDLELLARTCSASVIASPRMAKRDDLGKFESSEELNWSGITHWVVRGTNSKGMTLVIRGSNQALLDDIEKSFSDTLGVACEANEKGLFLPGGGATQMALSRHLKKWAEEFKGRESLAILAYADALEVIPRTLAINSGLDPIDKILKLNAAQASSKTKMSNYWGFDVETGEICNMIDKGIIENIRQHEQALASSTAAAISILRIDDVLWAKNDPTIPEGIEDEINEN